ncbi:polyphosphate kinase 2 family protein [Chachezhania antarctica]|uniref:polyphosphate kinase 2 family protein n=1 Tax=Chachezhania antarctica TaxID=2340860 RepID=UPI000EB2205A|nr:polyphosphate kinase [Chachezhania antarctica]|tara:strand:- start:8322 stop:9155 length:834 start_codon:yes stop_codon:yes gene_type:complete
MAKPRHSPPRLADADFSRKIGKDTYAKRLKRLQLKLVKIQQSYLFSSRKAVIVFEGWDAAGKGGTIRRLSMPLDPRSFKVWPIGAPRDYYLDRHYLLRFMERLPPAGAISVFDRSWYGRVLVERVEGLAPKDRWQAAYREIRDFERMLLDDNTRLVKLFFHITPEEQLRRFQERLHDPLKRWKLTYEDFRNREKWGDYADAIDDMFHHTSRPEAPWHLIPSVHKKTARIAALTLITDELSRGIDLDPPLPDGKVLKAADKVMDIDPDLIDSLQGRTD